MSQAALHGGDLLDMADRILRRIPAGREAEVTATRTASALTRFANGAIHQNVADCTTRLRLRLIGDGRAGVAEMQAESDDAAAALVQTAETVRSQAPPGEPVPLYAPDGGPDAETGYGADTEAVTPEQRADHVAVVCGAARDRGQTAFGACETGVTMVAMASTTGLRRSARHSVAELIAVCRGEDGSAYGARFAAGVSDLGVEDLAAEVVERCARNQRAQPLEPGTYQVVLSPYAVAEMLEYLGLMGLGGLALSEQRSFMRFGDPIMSASVSISDDVTRRELAPLAFDGEGATTRPVTLIDNGVGRAVVHDSVTATRAGVATTGHSFPQPNSDGPLPRYLCLTPGEGSEESMIAGCERGLLVTRFWYVRPVHPLATIITGMTRDGTFLIANGRVLRPVRDLRFTQSIVGALADVRAIGANRLASRGYHGATLAPWMHLGGFTFSS
ncbi:MAG: TldD/PmbA family protein [Candidatus Dormibacteraeota bacterium]|uniref:TldD/PmbA family protein n=1 Tax=Candidatus Amunia macphersoniae TaxID=3127014 RepID=A0A934KN20_9BACT|nr:TldD/PmbA family protein [Candidatus Dormibacteraeota bacterium]